MRGYEIVRVRDYRGVHHEARFSFDADDCEALAAGLSWDDKGGEELMLAASEIRAADEPDPDAPRLVISLVAIDDERSRS